MTLTITGNNDQPEIQNVTLSDLSEDGSLVADDGQEAARFEGSLPSVSDEDTTDTHSYSLVAESVTTNDNEMGVVDAANTAVTVNTDGGYSVVNPDFNALADGESVTVTFRYIATDDSGTDSASSEEKTVTLTITGNNDQPVIEDVTLSNLTEDGNLVENDGLEAARFTGSLSVSDEDSTDSHTFSLVAESVSTNDGELDVVNPENTSVTINPDGSYSVINPDFNRLDEDESVTVTFDYIATDDSGTSSASSDAKTVTLTISGSNDTPVAVADVDLSTEENSVLMVDVLANDTDEDDSDTPENFTLKSVALSQEGTGTVSIENNQLKFDPGADFDFLASGESTAVTVSYTMADDSGAESSSTATITVTGLNDPAVIEDVFNGFSGNVVENSVPGSKVTGQLSATDVDNSNADGFQAKSINGLFGTLVMQANGVWEYTLNNNHPVVDALNTDSPDLEDIITVHSIDGTPAEISITIAGSNDAPVVTETPINLNSTDEDQGIVITQQQLLAGSTDVDNALEDLSAENLSISSVSSGSGSLSYDPLSQSWTFKPSKDWSGQVTFNFDVSDGVDSTPSTATLTVDPVADKPILNVSNTSGNEDTAVALNIQAMLSDQDGSELLSPVSISNIPPGWQFINAQGELAVSVGILVLNPGDEVGLKAIPPLNYSGTHTFTVSVASNEQNSTSSELVQKPLEVEILPVAEPADLVVPASTSGNEDTPIDLSGIQVSVGDTGDTNEQVTQLILKGMPVGSVVSDGQQSVTITPSDVEMDILSWNLAQLTILPPENSDSDFQLQVTAVTRDGDSEATTDPQIISVNVVPVLDAPTVDLLYTNDPEPTLTGQVALGENEILQVLVNGQLFTAGVGSAPLKVDGDGQWSLDMAGNPLPADGVYEVTATVLNPSLDPNSIQDSTQNELVFDTRAPKGTVVFNHKTNDSTPEISGKLKATLGADEYLKVTVNGKTYVNREFPEQEEGVQLVEFIMGEDDRSWYFSIPDQDSINSSDEFGTEFEVEANVVDRAGNESPPDTADLLVDVNSPEIAPGSLVFSTGESINSVEATKTFKVSGMTDGAEQGQKVQIKLYQGDTEFNYEASVRADGSFVLTLYPQNPEHDSGRGIDLESFDDGTIQIDARVTDKLGNPSPVETDSTVLDTSLSGTEITIEAISNDSGVDNDFRTHDFDGLTLTGSLNQALTEDESLQISMDKGRTWLNSVTVNGQDWSYTEAEGTSRTNGQKVNYWLRVVDEAGNLAPQEEYAVQQVVFDNHAVITSLSLNKSGDISWNEAGSLVKVNGRTQGVESGQSVSIKLTGLIAGVATEYSYTTLVDNGRFTLELEQAFLRQFDDDSSVSFEASTNDLSDNQADQQHSVTLDFTVPGDTDGDHEPDNLGKPVVTLLGPDDGYINEGENTGGFKVLVSLPEGVEVGDRVRLSLKQVGGQSESIDYFVTAEDLLDDQAEVMIPERLLADGWTDGEYKINARISDDAGNTSKKGPAYLFTLDTTSPEADMTGPGQVNSQPFTTIFSLSDTRYTDENEWPELLPGDFNVENGVIESVTDLGNGQYELKIKPAFDPGVDQGNISIQLAADAVEDNAGNGNEFFEETITYDNDDPVIMLSSGLTGEVFNTNSSIPNLQAAFDLIQNNQPDASFTATKIDYSDNSAPTLAEFLGDGAEDLTGDTTANVETMAFRLSGQIELGVGTHSFRITSDDGFILRINGQEVAKYEGLRSAAPTAGTYTVDVNEGGAQSFELIYFENAVNAVLKVEIDRGNGYEILDQSSTLKNSTSYMEGNGAISLNQGLRLSDTDDTELAGAEVKIINFQQGEDVLDFTAANGISVESYDSQTGVLRLSGKASIAAYESALAAVTYENTSEDPLAGQRLLSVKINDGHTWSDPVTTTLTVFAINDAPEMAVQSLPLDYVENDGYQTLDSNLSLSDVDNENLHSVTIRISEGYVNGQERLELDNSLYDSAKISALWNGQGFLKLTAKDPVNNPVSVSEFEALLRQVQYQNSSDNPVEGARTVSWIANDGQDDSLTVESTINVTAENDSAYVTQVRNWTYEENSGQVVLDNALTLVDPDSTHIKSVTVSISKNYDADHDLLRVLSEQPDVSVNWNALTGTLSITALNPAGLEKQAFEQVLETITFTSTGDNPSTAQRELTWKVNDGQGDGQSVVSRISIRALNDAPENYFDENELSSDALNLAQSPIQATEDTVLLIDQLSIQDADANDEAIRVTLQVEHGRLSMGSSDGLSLNGQDSNSLTLQGSQKAINQALKTLTYQGLPDYNGSDKLVMISNDRGNNGNGGTQETRSEIAIDVAAVNDKPLLATSSGLKVEVFDVSPVSESAFNSLSEVLTFMDDEAPDATFLAHTLAFDDGNPDTLSQFIGNNGSELSGLGDEPFESMGLRFTGQIKLDAGDHNFTVRSDDGFSLKINGQVVTEFDRDRGAGNSSGRFSANTDGLYDIEIVYWENRGSAVLEVSMDGQILDASLLFSNSQIEQTYQEGQTEPTQLFEGMMLSDVDGTLESLVVEITGDFDQQSDLYQAQLPAGIIRQDNYENGVLTVTFSGTAPVAAYQALLSSIHYENTSDDPVEGDREIRVWAHDGELDSDVLNATLTVTAENDHPVAQGFVIEPVSETVDFSQYVSDPDHSDAQLQVIIEQLPEYGRLFLQHNGTEQNVEVSDLGTTQYNLDDLNYEVADLDLGTASQPGMQGWGILNNDGNVLTSTHGNVTVTTSTQNGEFQQYNQPGHVGIGLGIKNHGIKRSNAISVQYSAAIAFAVIGVDGLGGHFDAGASQKGAVKVSVTFEDGSQGTWSFNKAQLGISDSDYSASISVGHGSQHLINTEGLGIVQMDFSAASNNSLSNWVLSSIESSVSDSFSYKAVDPDDAVSVVQTVNIKGGAISGTEADDLITGTTADDVLIGNGGADTFQFTLNNLLEEDSVQIDRILDFKVGNTSGDTEADYLDLSDLLVTENTSDIAQFISDITAEGLTVTVNQDNTVIEFNSTADSDLQTLHIVLDGVSTEWGVNASDEDVITQLISNGQLIV
ncbi:tandem-95 repeat protein [Endozoicomonas numazuensis]|uniref:tandem-95 repeat protein n=1 Tax=Endozoicomonas numazuensis TaxID=1137799 RepID=UPI000AB0AF39|nr:tandem-95 repeat protein [Endozoicomonas numazuensis]